MSSTSVPLASAPVPDDRVRDDASDPRQARLLAALRRGDERAFTELIRQHHGTMVRLARVYVPSEAVAEEVVQETWEAVLSAVDRFQGRSTLKTWIFRILINRAKTRGNQERRTIPASSLHDHEEGSSVVDPALFQGPDGEEPGGWVQSPRPWQDPERRLASLEVRERLRAALEELPERQRLVVGLRDVDGFSAEDVCELLELKPTHQRVLLHRARLSLRDALDELVA
jgi:RNA polymerase sigma-70 factor, ECF subfamily